MTTSPPEPIPTPPPTDDQPPFIQVRYMCLKSMMDAVKNGTAPPNIRGPLMRLINSEQKERYTPSDRILVQNLASAGVRTSELPLFEITVPTHTPKKPKKAKKAKKARSSRRLAPETSGHSYPS